MKNPFRRQPKPKPVDYSKCVPRKVTAEYLAPSPIIPKQEPKTRYCPMLEYEVDVFPTCDVCGQKGKCPSTVREW